MKGTVSVVGLQAEESPLKLNVSSNRMFTHPILILCPIIVLSVPRRINARELTNKTRPVRHYLHIFIGTRIHHQSILILLCASRIGSIMLLCTLDQRRFSRNIYGISRWEVATILPRAKTAPAGRRLTLARKGGSLAAHFSMSIRAEVSKYQI